MSKLFRSSLLLTLLLAFSALAHAQKPAITQNRDEPARNPYLQNVFFNQNQVCTTTLCTVTFPAVPAGYRLVVTYVSFRFRLTAGTAGAFVTLGDGGVESFGRQVDLPVPVSTGSFYTILSSPVNFYIEAGQTPVVVLNADGIAVNPGFSDGVSLVGYLVQIP